MQTLRRATADRRGEWGLVVEGQQPLDPGEQPEVVERHLEVDVGAGGEPGPRGGVVPGRGEHQDRHPAELDVAADLGEHLDPTHPGHRHVQQDQIDAAAVELVQRLGPVGGLDHVVALDLEDVPQQ